MTRAFGDSVSFNASVEIWNHLTSSNSVTVQGGTSSSGGPGIGGPITILIQPDPGESVGQPVTVDIHGVGGWPGTDTHAYVDTYYNVTSTFRSTSKTLAEGTSGIRSGDASFTALIGETFQVSASFRITVQPPDAPFVSVTQRADVIVNLSKVTTPLPNLSVTPKTIEFGSVTVGQHKTATFVVENAGAAGSVLKGNVGDAEGPFRVASGGGQFLLASGEKREVEVTFLPDGTGPGSQDGKLLVTADNAAPVSVELKGTVEQENNIVIASVTLATPFEINYGYNVSGSPGPFEVDFYLSKDNLYSNGDLFIGSQAVVPSPNTSGSGKLVLSSSISRDPDYPYLIAVADPVSETKPFGEVRETEEVRDNQGCANIVDDKFSIEKIPYIEDNRGWHVAASLLRTWFNGEKKQSQENSNARPQVNDFHIRSVPIDLQWVLQVGRARRAVKALQLKFAQLDRFSPRVPIALKNVIVDRLRRQFGATPFKDYQKVDLSTLAFAKSSPQGILATPPFHLSQQVDHATVPQTPVADGFRVRFGDDVQAGLGGFSIYAAPIGTAYKVGNKINVEIIGVYIWVRDSFDFNGTQAVSLIGLGSWKLPDGFIPGRGANAFGYTFVDNANFRQFREQNNRGGDFQIYSTIEAVPVVRAAAFTFNIGKT